MLGLFELNLRDCHRLLNHRIFNLGLILKMNQFNESNGVTPIVLAPNEQDLAQGMLSNYMRLFKFASFELERSILKAIILSSS